MRKLNEQSDRSPVVAAAVPLVSSRIKESVPHVKADTIVLDPGAKARNLISGGQMEPTEVQTSPVDIIGLKPGQSAWAAVLENLAPDLMHAAWQTRHGAVLGIMEISRYVGSSLSQFSLFTLARKLLVVLATDRFGDFVGDTVIAPVRETAAQALGLLMRHLDGGSVREVHRTLMGMVQQSWATRTGGKDTGERFTWEVRHAGLLGLKYEVAVRSDLLGPVKAEKVDLKLEEGDVKPNVEIEEMDLLGDVVHAVILAYVPVVSPDQFLISIRLQDVDDDVRTVAASALSPITQQLATQLPHGELSKMVDTLWDCLSVDRDELGSGTGAVIDLMSGCPGDHMSSD